MASAAPPNDPASSGGNPRDAEQAAAKAAREEAIRALLAAPVAEATPPAPRHVPPSATPGPVELAQDLNLPIPQSEARLRSAPYSALEVGLGLLVVVLAVALACMAGSEFRTRRRVERCAAELRTLAAAFAQYRSIKGEWPAAAAAAGAVPAEMEQFLSRDIWSRPTPLGGHYAWLKGIGETRPALGITAFVPDPPLNLSRDELQRLDRLVDDGDLGTGRFQAGFNGWPVYSLTDGN